MDAKGVVEIAGAYLASLSGHSFHLLTLSKPVSPSAALNLAKVVSKLSSLLGNLIEFNAVELLNDKEEFKRHGRWKRQDPDFPDAIFEGKVRPIPGMEIKAWFPLATEITARFRESQNHFTDGRTTTHVCMLAWLPEHLIYGRPYVLDVVVADGFSVAKARDDHYHNPPDYLVLEPEDTKERTRNLQQTNTNGYKFQGTAAELDKAVKLVESWGAGGKKYKPTRGYQQRIRDLTSRFKYRLDTNYAKMDRIAHPAIEEFKTRVCGTKVNGMTVAGWTKLFASIKVKKTSNKQSREQLAKMAARLAENEALVKAALAEHLEIAEEDAGKLLA
ncbi:MAG: hypothetical protein LAO04_09515 [Acidobacteriia bacterium]|nr:hypothetical protein [Terriglobia bacterium]